MGVKDQITRTASSGHESHGVHLCRRCGWHFPNPHPSAKHRRAHKKICGTIDGYTNFTGSDDDKEKTPSPKIGKKMNIGDDGGGIRGSFSRSEDELFSDAVTEFSESGTSTGSAHKTLDRDLFFSFEDAENDGTNELLNAPIEISKVDTSVGVSEKIDTHVEKLGETEITAVCDSSESNFELTEMGSVKDGVVGPPPEPSHIFHSQETISVDVVEVREENVQGSQTSVTIAKEAKDSELTKRSADVSAIVDGDRDNVKQGNFEKLESSIADGIIERIKQEIESDCEHVSEVVNEYGSVEETNVEKFELEYETASEVGTDHLEGVAEDIKHENSQSDHKHVPEVAKESASVQSVSVFIGKEDFGAPSVQIQEVTEPNTVLTEKEDLGEPHLEKQLSKHTHEVVENPVFVLTQKQDIGAPELEKSSKEQIQEVVKKPETDLTEQEDLGGPHLEKQLDKHTHVVIEKPVSVFTEKQDLGAPELEKSSNEQIQEVMMQPDTVLIDKEYLGGPHLEEQSNEHNHQVIEKLDSVLTESQDLGAPELEKCSEEHVEEPNLILTAKEDLGAPKSEKCSIDNVIEQKVDDDSSVVADVIAETITQKFPSDISVVNGKNVSDAVHVPNVEEGKMNNQDSGAALSVDSSTRSSLEGNWGSVSVLSTASIDGGTLQSTEKSKVNSRKSNAATSDVFKPPSFMTLVEAESKDKKPESSEVQDSQKQPNSDISQAGWFPTMAKVNNESEGRKKNEEVIAKVANWSTGKQSMPLKNLLGEAKSPSGAQPEPVVQKDEAIVNPLVNDDVSTPPKMIDDDKKGRKKVKGISSWVPFVCCSSVNVVN